MSRLRYLVRSKTLFSSDLSGNTSQILKDSAAFTANLATPDPLDLFNVQDWLPRLTKLRSKSIVRRLRAIVSSAIDLRSERLASGSAVRSDLLTLLQTTEQDSGVALTRKAIEDNIYHIHWRWA